MYQIKIKHLENLHRPWLIYRLGGKYEQHAHCRTKQDALHIRKLIDCKRYPEEEEHRVAVKRLLTSEELQMLKRKPRFYRPVMKRG